MATIHVGGFHPFSKHYKTLQEAFSHAMDSDTIGIYKKNRRAYAFYTLNTSGLRSEVVAELENACEENRLCEDGETEEEDNCIKRPPNKC